MRLESRGRPRFRAFPRSGPGPSIFAPNVLRTPARQGIVRQPVHKRSGLDPVKKFESPPESEEVRSKPGPIDGAMSVYLPERVGEFPFRSNAAREIDQSDWGIGSGTVRLELLDP